MPISFRTGAGFEESVKHGQNSGGFQKWFSGLVALLRKLNRLAMAFVGFVSGNSAEDERGDYHGQYSPNKDHGRTGFSVAASGAGRGFAAYLSAALGTFCKGHSVTLYP